MLFSSMTFLWLFLPSVFLIHLLLPQRMKNGFLLIASLLFYSWGEPVYIFLMISSIIVNYILALCIDRCKAKKILIGGVVFNIGLLWYFKYFTTFLLGINKVACKVGVSDNLLKVREIALPLGISFYTFQILSYLIDVYRGKCEVQKSIVKFALYVSFFPQLVAGPIVKYKDISWQIENRRLNSTQIAVGIKRFIYGLSKKVILANTIATVVNGIFSAPAGVVGSKWLWVGTILYTLQIYYDFSGYSDMAIGLGKMFGFEFAENFNYPYISLSIQEFWRRWHISLSSWFKEYLYIPLGGNRKGTARTYYNLAVVFVITGIWHGATLNFLLWGCFHGFFSLLERIGLGRWLETNKCKLINHVYTMLVVSIGWAIFRCDSLIESLVVLKNLFVWRSSKLYVWYDFFSIRSITIIIIAILLVGVLQEHFKKWKYMIYDTKRVYAIEGVAQAVLLIVCVVLLIGGQYNPFIYFKF